MDLEPIYWASPLWLQNVAVCLEGWRIRRSRYGGSYRDILREAEKRTDWSAEQLRTYRDQRLRAFIRHCGKTVPFYHRLFEKLGFHPEEFRGIEDLQHLPVLTKKHVQNHYSELISTGLPQKRQHIIHTSGTTGSGLRFAATRTAIQEQRAIWWRYRRWHGLRPDTWCGYFSGRLVVPLSQRRPPFWRYNYPGKKIHFSGYHMAPQNLANYVSELRRHRPPWLHGYPSAMCLLASYIVDRRIDVGYEIRWLTTGGEALLGHQRNLLQQAFGVRPKQHYGMAEAVANASECECGQLHVDEDFAAVEFVQNPNGPGKKVIGTNFSNPATPLLRYDPGDLVTLSEGLCPCGKHGRVLQTIDGRSEDYVMLRNGAPLGTLDNIFNDLVNIRAAQIFQKEAGEITIRVVRGIHYADKDEQMLLGETRKRVGEETDVLLEYVEDLERSRSGKLRFVVSEIREAQLNYRR